MLLLQPQPVLLLLHRENQYSPRTIRLQLRAGRQLRVEQGKSPSAHQGNEEGDSAWSIW